MIAGLASDVHVRDGVDHVLDDGLKPVVPEAATEAKRQCLDHGAVQHGAGHLVPGRGSAD